MFLPISLWVSEISFKPLGPFKEADGTATSPFRFKWRSWKEETKRLELNRSAV